MKKYVVRQPHGRLAHPVTHPVTRRSENDNAYAHPCDLLPIVDLAEGKVCARRDGDATWLAPACRQMPAPAIRLCSLAPIHPSTTHLPPMPSPCGHQVVKIEMDDSPYDVPKADHNYHADLYPGPWRQGLKPLDILQPEVRAPPPRPQPRASS